MTPSFPLLLRLGVHNPIDNLMKQPTPLRIRQNDRHRCPSAIFLQSPFQISSNSSNRTTRPGPRNECIYPSGGLAIDFGTATSFVGGEIGEILELIGEMALGWCRWWDTF